MAHQTTKTLLLTGLATAAMAIASGVSATAAEPTQISGTVTCANSMVQGVWIEATSSTSGWANWEMPLQLNGLTQAEYSYTLDGGGGYAVHVGCGGTTDRWAVSAKSEVVYGTDNSFICNDIPGWLQAAGDWAFGRAGFGFIGFSDLPAYETCDIK